MGRTCVFPLGHGAGPAVRIGIPIPEPLLSLTTADVDGDGLQDLYLVTAAATRVLKATAQGGFAVAAGHPLAGIVDGQAALWGDVDNDGDTDLYLCRRGANQLWRSEQDGTWVETAAVTGTADSGDCADGGMIDADHDGDLDLFVTNYVKWSREDDLQIDFRLTGLGRAYGAPVHFVGTNSYLYRNQGDGRSGGNLRLYQWQCNRRDGLREFMDNLTPKAIVASLDEDRPAPDPD